MTVIVSVANMKGGVGKTTTCMMLAEGLAARGRRVLLAELDPQASLTFIFRGGAALAAIDRSGRNVGDVLFPDAMADEVSFLAALVPAVSTLSEVERARGRVDLLPATPRMRFDEMRFEAVHGGSSDDVTKAGRALGARLRERMAPVLGPYDYILLDCAPNFGPLAQGALLSSDLILVPTLADPVSTFGLATFLDHGLNRSLNLADRTPLHVVVSKFIANQETRRTLNLLVKSYDVLEPPIPHSVSMLRALHAPDPGAARTITQKYDALTQHVHALAQSFEAVVPARAR
ncbi:MAG: ParA family protein [Caulobacterales bacterium]|nr:ParA family protein [Caulobacterales bacterium]